MILLDEYIRNFLKESNLNESLNLKDSSSIQDTITNLNNESQSLKDELASQDDAESFDHYISDRLDDVIGNFDSDFEYLDDGAFRKVYALPGQGWVLKLAHHTEGAKVNRQEIQMSGIDQNDDVYHGLGARNIFTKVYDYDRDNDLPWWIISQRVVPLHDIHDLELLKVIFPTFWNILSIVNSNENELDRNLKIAESCMTQANNFVSFITLTLTKSMINSKRIKKPTEDYKGWDYLYKKQKPPYFSNKVYRGLTKEIFYNSMIKYYSFNIPSIESINFGKDFERLSRGLAYVGTTDLHEGNIGIVRSVKPSPDDIVILDFDIHS